MSAAVKREPYLRRGCSRQPLPVYMEAYLRRGCSRQPLPVYMELISVHLDNLRNCWAITEMRIVASAVGKHGEDYQ
jgi:hypothetical protein